MISYPTSYVAFDTETTGFMHTDEIIEIGAVKVLDGEPTETFSSLINPVCDISKTITQITGITNDMVEDAPCLAQVIPMFLDFVGDLPIVGHNVSFDRRFLFDACAALGLDAPSNTFVDTLKMARDRYPDLENHRLGTVAFTLGVIPEGAHRAVDDADTTRQCYEILRRVNLPKRRKSAAPPKKPQYRPFFCWQPTSTPDLGGASFCITGELSAFSRDEAFSLIESLHGVVKKSVSKRLNFLVVSPPYDPNCPGKTNKILDAESVIAAGAPLRILNEAEFMAMLGFEYRGGESSR